ncbi:MAG: hypothetical protein IJ058_01625 [Lachnospiraceae bacterium]|nr:hypothetical protein [Lachnospiraceae bacterium]
MPKFDSKTIYSANLKNQHSSSKYRIIKYDVNSGNITLSEKDSEKTTETTFSKMINNIAAGQIYVMNLGNLSKDMTRILKKYDV